MIKRAKRAVCGLTVAMLLSAVALIPAADARPEATQEGRKQAIEALSWLHGGEIKLPDSDATLRLPARYLALTGPDAVVLIENINATTTGRGVEAVVYDPMGRALVEFRAVRDGYVRFDDWNKVDADRMLADLREGTEAANQERVRNGEAPLSVTGWRETPRLDLASRTVHWQIAGTAGGKPVLNAVTLTFGRRGYEKLTWMGPADADPRPLVEAVMTGFSYNPGARYEEFRDGDKVAEYGVATLIASAVGAKVAAKLGLLAVGLAFFKKAWIIFLLGPALVWKWVRGLFTGKREGDV